MNHSQQPLVSIENLPRIQAVTRSGSIQSAVLSLAIWGAINLGTWYFMGTEDRQFLSGLGSHPTGSLYFLMYGGLFLGVGMLTFAALGYLSQTSISVVLNGLSLIAVGIWNVVYNFVAMGVLEPYGYDVNPISFWALLGLAQVIWGFQQLSLFGRVRRWPSTRLPASELKALKDGLNDFSQYKESIEAGIVKASTMQQVLGIATLSRTTQYTGRLMEDCALLVSAKLDDCITLDRRAMREAIFPEQTGTTLTVRETPNRPHLDLIVGTTSLIAFKLWCGQPLTMSDLQRVAPPAKKGAPVPSQTVPVSLFRPFLQGGEPQVRVAMLASLKGVAGPATRELVVAALEDPAAVVVAAAIDACRVTRIEDVHAQVVLHLAAADPLVRLAAVHYLETFPDGDTRAALEQAGTREDVPALKEVITSVLGSLPPASDLIRSEQVPETPPVAVSPVSESAEISALPFESPKRESVPPVAAFMDVSEAVVPACITTPSQGFPQRETVLPDAVSGEAIEAHRPTPALLCPHCHQEHPESILYCPHSGKKIHALEFCPHCHRPVEPEWVYCGFCSGDLDLAASRTAQRGPVVIEPSPAPETILAEAESRKPFPRIFIPMIAGGVGLLLFAAAVIINNLNHRGAEITLPSQTPSLSLVQPPVSIQPTAKPSPTPYQTKATQFLPTGPDRILFASNQDGNFEIYVMSAGGTVQARLTNNQQTDDTHPAWSPDGEKIAFVSNRNGNPEIYVMNADGSQQTRLTDYQSLDTDPAWSPVGGKIVFASNRDHDSDINPENSEIYVMDADGSNQTRLTNNPGDDGIPAWSPDGRKIAFNANRDGNADIYVMDADGSNQVRLTDHLGVDGYPAWSPDGGKIAFNTNRDGNWEIYVMDADGSNQVNLSNNPADEGFPTWSADGSKIVFASIRDGNYEIYVMDADGSHPSRITYNQATNLYPKWLPGVLETGFVNPQVDTSISSEELEKAGEAFANGISVYLYDPQPKNISLSELDTTLFSLRYLLPEDAGPVVNALVIWKVNAQGAQAYMVADEGSLIDWTARSGEFTFDLFNIQNEVNDQQTVVDPSAWVFQTWVDMTPLYGSPNQQQVDAPQFLEIFLVSPEPRDGSLFLSEAAMPLSNLVRIEVIP